MGKILNFILMIFGVLVFAQGTDFVSFPMMNMEIRHALEEHERQKDMHENQIGNTISEDINRNFWNDVKEVKTKIQQRLRIIDFTLQAIPTGYKLYQDSQDIIRTQGLILNELEDAPYVLINIYRDQISFLDDLHMTTRFIAGIVASYGTLNQMERAERQIFLNHALDEIKRLKRQSSATLWTIKDVKAKLRSQGSRIDYMIGRDKRLIEDILNNMGL